ncbi:hypothetical protein AVEN_223801-1 [Araneus ventricosus]|uniref:Uncharacterized protein n=1 Tax=Araneus ventricosus TaxID=182803 RepID=A0A4Y2DM35_ARAVE|nr:hypothetical protein AVEN_223801-1 [Araneus ventricosus]
MLDFTQSNINIICSNINISVPGWFIPTGLYHKRYEQMVAGTKLTLQDSNQHEYMPVFHARFHPKQNECKAEAGSYGHYYKRYEQMVASTKPILQDSNQHEYMPVFHRLSCAGF